MESYRILFFVSSLKLGGAENHLLNLCRFLKSSSHVPAVCTVSSRSGELEDVIAAESIPLFRLDLGSLKELAFPGAVLKVRRIVREFAPDIIHAHMFHAEVVSALAARFSNAPLFATRHSAGLEFEGGRRWAVRMMRSRFDLLFAVSDEALEEAVRMGYSRKRLVTLPNAVDIDRFRPLDDAQKGERKQLLLEAVFPGRVRGRGLIVGSVGGLKSVKNLALIPRIAARFLRERPDLAPSVRFVIVGEGPQREELTRIAEELRASAVVTMPGSTDRPEDYYPLFDVFILPSLTEGVPMALLEAMASGAACVATDVGGVGELLGPAGELVQSGDEDALYRAVEMLLDDASLRRELGEKARRRVADNYDIRAWGRRIEDAYRSAFVGKRGG